MMFRAFLTVTAILMTASATGQVFNTEKGRIIVATVASGLEQPWGIEFLPDGRMIVLKDCGHMMMSEQPNETLDALIQALR